MFDSHVRGRRARGLLPMPLLAPRAGDSAFAPTPTRSARPRRLLRALAAVFACAMLHVAWASSLAPPATNGVIAFDGIGLVNPDGSGQTSWTYEGTDAAWSPDGKKIAFEAGDYDQFGSLMVANADGTGLTQLTDGGGYEDKWPSWSPDGSKILFWRPDALHVINSDGTNLTTLPLQGYRASWSADGTKIIYIAGGQTGDLYVANADGSNPTFLGIHYATHPAWSRDGTRIVYSAWNWTTYDTTYDIYTANPDGSDARQLTSGYFDEMPAWSPDGKQLVFYRSGDYVHSGESNGVWVMSADGSGLTMLVANTWAYFPAWQPIPTAPPAFPFTGFFSPIGPAGTLNVAKAGSAVPVKFSLGGNRGLDIFAAGSPSTQAIACTGTGDATTAVATGSAGSSGLTYDATSDLYTYVMKTEKAWANTCRRLTVTLTDGTSHTADFRFN